MNRNVIDVVLDTDTYNEIDDQYALAYLLRSQDRLRIKGIYAAPFHNLKSVSPKDGMEKSYEEIFKVLELADEGKMKNIVYKGSEKYLDDEKTPVNSDAATHLAKLAEGYSPQNPLYVIAIGAITNVASAILKNPMSAKNIVAVWLGGQSHDRRRTEEFNMMQDIAAARTVFLSEARIVQLPCAGVVSELRTTKPELEYWLLGKNKLCDYLVENTVREAESYAAGKPWSRVIWDISAVAYMLNDENRFMLSREEKTLLPDYNCNYEESRIEKTMEYVYQIERDAIFEDLFKKLM